MATGFESFKRPGGSGQPAPGVSELEAPQTDHADNRVVEIKIPATSLADGRARPAAPRVLHYAPNINLQVGGGVARFIMDLVGATAAAGMNITLASSDFTDAPGEWGRPGTPRTVELPPMGGANRFFGQDGVRIIRDLLAEHDVVHLHGAWQFANIQIARLARAAKVPYVASPHGMLDDWCMEQSWLRKRIFCTLLGRPYWAGAATVMCTAEGECERSSKWLAGTRTAVVPPVLAEELFQQLPGPEQARAAFPAPLDRAPTVLFLSRVHHKKRPDVLIDAVSLLKRRGLACNLFIAGSGEDSYVDGLKRRVEQQDVADRTRFLGWTKGGLKLSLYQAADVFALPTCQENFGLVLTEAMACGAPVVTTRGTDISPELETSRGAILADNTPAAFAEAIERLIANPALRAQMSARARDWVMTSLDPSRVVEKYRVLYTQLSGMSSIAGSPGPLEGSYAAT